MNEHFGETTCRRLAAAMLRRTVLQVLAVAASSSLAPSGIAHEQSTPTAGAAGMPAAGQTFDIVGLVQTPGPIAVDALRSYPVETVESTYAVAGEPEMHTFTGVLLFDVVNGAGFAVDAADPGALLELHMVITAKDGYQVVLSVGAIAPDFGGAPILLTWEEDGASLAPSKGPVQLVEPGDRTEGRYIFGIVIIDVRSAAAPA